MKRKVIFSVLTISILGLVGCNSSGPKNNTEATTAEENYGESEIYTENDGAEWDTNIKNDSESYLNITEEDYTKVEDEAVKTVSLKVDTASYRNIIRHINNGEIINKDAVRIEEMVNYFNYDEDTTFAQGPFSTYMEIGQSPFNDDKEVLFIRTKTEDLEKEDLEGVNLVFLIDTSGSMYDDKKLPLLKSSFKLLVDTLDENDTVSIVTYAGSSDVVLNGVNGSEKTKIIDAINSLEAAGSTAGAEGILTAYELAEENFIEDGNNRVILATDGDFNVGVSSERGLEELITEKRESDVYLSILGFGSGNLKDSKMETLSKYGNGNYSYIDNLDEAKKVLVKEITTNLYTVANDVKMQVEFNNDFVDEYRIVGYENRVMRNEDFDDDSKDAGEIGIGTDTLLLFEIDLKDEVEILDDDILVETRVRYKNPNEEQSNLFTAPVLGSDIKTNNSSDFNFATAVAKFGLILRDSQFIENANIDDVLNIAMENTGVDEDGYREEFINIVKKYKEIVR